MAKDSMLDIDDDRLTVKLIEDVRWVKDKRGIKRLKIDNVTKQEYCARRHERKGWRNGARIRA
jgi:hypothetical protein